MATRGTTPYLEREGEAGEREGERERETERERTSDAYVDSAMIYTYIRRRRIRVYIVCLTRIGGIAIPGPH